MTGPSHALVVSEAKGKTRKKIRLYVKVDILFRVDFPLPASVRKNSAQSHTIHPFPVYNSVVFSILMPSILQHFCHTLPFPDSSVGKESTKNAGDPGSPGLGRSAGEGIGYPLQDSWASLVAQLVKKLPAMQETWVQSLGWEDPLEKGTHSSILA